MSLSGLYASTSFMHMANMQRHTGRSIYFPTTAVHVLGSDGGTEPRAKPLRWRRLRVTSQPRREQKGSAESVCTAVLTTINKGKHPNYFSVFVRSCCTKNPGVPTVDSKRGFATFTLFSRLAVAPLFLHFTPPPIYPPGDPPVADL